LSGIFGGYGYIGGRVLTDTRHSGGPRFRLGSRFDLQRARRNIGKMEGDEPTWISSMISKPCLW
jgi:hypothetical protein